MGMLQARILEWVAMPSSRGFSGHRDWTPVSCIAGRFFTVWVTRGGRKPKDRVLIRHRTGETETQRRSHVETQTETGGRRPPAQGRTPGAPRSWKRWEGPCPGASAGSSALGHPDLRRLVPRVQRRWMSTVSSFPVWWKFVMAAPGATNSTKQGSGIVWGSLLFNHLIPHVYVFADRT